MNGSDALTVVALGTLAALAILELHLELAAGAVAWLGARWMLREPAPRP